MDEKKEAADKTIREPNQFRFANLRAAAMTSALFHGQIFFDKSGNLLPNSIGVATTISYFVSSSPGTITHHIPDPAKMVRNSKS